MNLGDDEEPHAHLHESCESFLAILDLIPDFFASHSRTLHVSPEHELGLALIDFGARPGRIGRALSAASMNSLRSTLPHTSMGKRAEAPSERLEHQQSDDKVVSNCPNSIDDSGLWR
jgi:hypothetical protein